jgi:histidine triad (HIT) family protein
MENCIFCKIIKKEIPSDIIYEDAEVMAILDIRPVTKGHALIMPKKHSEDLLSTEEEQIGLLMTAAKKIAKAVLNVTNSEGFNVHINNGSAAGQAVFHLHVHIIPRYHKDGLEMWGHQEVSSLSRKKLAEEIKKAI